MHLSYRRQLSKIKESPEGEGISYRAFECTSDSLKQTMRAMDSPDPKSWSVSSEYKDANFHESSQGVAHDGRYWYFTANGNKGRQGVFKYTTSMKLVKSLKLTDNMKLMRIDNIPFGGPHDYKPYKYPKFHHVGDPECYKDQIFLPMQGPHGFLTVHTSLDPSTVEWHPTPNIGDSHPWCAINPLNGMLYTSDFTGEDVNKGKYELILFAYHPETFDRAPDKDIRLQTPTFRVQGGCFSPDGILFLTSDAKIFKIALKTYTTEKVMTDASKQILENFMSKEMIERLSMGDHLDNIEQVRTSGIPLDPCITCYSPINGHFFGSIPIMREISLNSDQEVEGITYWERKERGKKTRLHVVLLENELGTDEVFFKHYSDSSK